MDTYLELEMTLAGIMSRQEASGFRLDLAAAKKVEKHLQHRFNQLLDGMKRKFYGIPGKVKKPKRPNKTKRNLAD